MLSEASQRGDLLGEPVKAIRCQACGRRARGPCPECGALEITPTGEPAEREFSDVFYIESPRFTGYRTSRILGRGGFGTVFEAEPEQGGSPVAIKLARADRRGASAHLALELEVLSAVGPPHVPAVLASGELDDGSPYAVITRVDAPTLADRLARRPAPQLEEACALARAALVALEAVHARGYLHCDLKPENIFVDEALRATIIDFGIARAVGHAVEATDEGAAPGTAEYMAPEQIEGQADLDTRVDVYAMGVILYELLAGSPPFWGPQAAVLEHHRSRRPQRLSARAAVPAALEDVVHRCLAKDRSDRFAGAAELRAALEAALAAGAQNVAMTPPQAASAQRSARGIERHTVSLLFFEAEVDLVTVQRQIKALGGELAHAAGGHYVAVFEHESAGNPARRALRAADDLLQAGLCRRGLCDLAQVSVQTRADGTRRYMSPLFARADRWPAASGPPGLFLSPAVAAVLPDLLGATPVTHGPQLSELGPDDDTREDTTANPLIGRSAVLDRLMRGAREALEHRAATVAVVLGEPGHGKSHLLAELVKRLGQLAKGARLIELRAREPSCGGADTTLRELTQQALDLPTAPPEGGGRALLERRLGSSPRADLFAAVALALGWADERAGAARYPELRAREAAPGALRSARVMAAGESLRICAASRPTFVLLDDAHFAPDATLGALDYAARADAPAPLWICALGRTDFEHDHPAWGERAARREIVRLAALDPESARELCRRLLLPARDVPEPAIAHLVERSQRVPLLLVELVHGLKREGVLRRHPRGDAWYLATDELDRLPALPRIEQLAQSEVAALAPTLSAHARLCALLGEGASIEEIEGVLRRLDQRGQGDDFPLDARIGTQRLVSAGLLVIDRKGRLGFRHALVREAIAQSATEFDRRRIHLAAYEHHRDAADDERRLFKIAHHAAEAGLGAIAADAYLSLAERARARHAYVEAEMHYSRALAQPDGATGEKRGEAQRGRGLMRYRLGRYHDALADFAEARAAAEERGDEIAQIEILLDEATALDWMDEYASSKVRVEEAMAKVSRDLPPALAARLVMAQGRSLHRENREDEAAALLEIAAARAESLGDEGYETLVVSLLMLGFIYQGLGWLEGAGAALDRAIALCEARGDVLHLGPAINNRALLRACLGDKEGMIVDLYRVLSLARDLGQGMLELVGEFNLGEYLYLMDDLDAAAPHVERAMALERQRRGEDARPVVLLLGARLLLYRGELTAARSLIEAIHAREPREGAKMAPAEEVLWSMIELSTREASDDEWDALEGRSSQFSVGQEQLEVIEARARAELGRGRRAEGRATLQRAITAASGIPNVMKERLLRQASEAEN